MTQTRNWFGLVIGALGLIFCTSALGQDSDVKMELVESWRTSPHADLQSPSFSHWDADGAIPENCATCHSGAGFREFFGLDGSPVGEIAHPVPVGGIVDCDTCHADSVKDIQAITFPSRMSVAPQGSTATCMTCHQGRESGLSVAEALVGLDDDTVDTTLGFINPHYAVAAATQLGTEVKGGYEYPGRDYMGRFAHVPPVSTCIDCHDPHSLQIDTATCIGCHETADLRTIRTSRADFDGDGAVTAGIHAEIATMTDTLLTVIGRYAEEVAGTPIAYADRYPYFFVAKDGAPTGDRYGAWTPALLRAAYNFQFVSKDKGAYAHNPHYAVQLLHDSTEDLAQRVGGEVMLGERP